MAVGQAEHLEQGGGGFGGVSGVEVGAEEE